MSLADTLIERAALAKQASRELLKADHELRNRALRQMATELRARHGKILRANEIDMENGQLKGLSTAMLDRLRLDEKRIEDMAVALEEIAAFADPLAASWPSGSAPTACASSVCRCRWGW